MAVGVSPSHDERVQAIARVFGQQFGRAPEGFAEAPGRVNLIGEHVDYNDGLVLPFAIDRSVIVAWARRDDDGVWVYSADFDEHSRFNLKNVTNAEPGVWANYVRGVASVLAATEMSVGGMEIALTGDVPQGAGLSSSAAIEVAVAGAFRDAYALPIDDVALARLCQRAENEFVGVRSGVMDQFASTVSRRGHALLIDCRTFAHEAVPLHLEAAGLAIVIADSGVTRRLVKSAYNDRRRECAEAGTLLREKLSRPELTSLRDVTVAAMDSLAIGAGDADRPLRRARHVVTEIARVAATVDALGRDDFATVGALMEESHRSLRDDYEVSSPQLDLLVGLATAQEYVLGARLTGAGFGGYTVNLIRADAHAAFERDVMAPYRERTRLVASPSFVTTPQDGLRTWRA